MKDIQDSSLIVEIYNSMSARCFLNFFHARTVSPTGYRPIGSIFSLSGMNAVQKFAETRFSMTKGVILSETKDDPSAFFFTPPYPLYINSGGLLRLLSPLFVNRGDVR